MHQKVLTFAEAFQQFITERSDAEQGQITLKKYQNNWVLSYESDSEGIYQTQEFATPFFLSCCPFYAEMQSMLKELDNRIDCENFCLTISLFKDYSPSWTMNALEEFEKDQEEEL